MRPERIFSGAEIGAIGKCLRCALEGEPVLPHWEFPILTGVAVEDALGVVAAWPNVDFSDDISERTVYGVLLNLRGYPHKQWEKVTQETGLSKEEIRALFSGLKKAFPPPGG